MGYTHYFHSKELDEDAFEEFSKDAARLIKSSPVKLAFEYDKPGDPPLVTHDEVRFNGVGDKGHETFSIRRSGGDEFCKTAQKPYDLIVTAILIAAKKHFGNAIEVRSDGDNIDWEAGRDLCSKVLGYGEELYINEENHRTLEGKQ
jgi:hypothetical protein